MFRTLTEARVVNNVWFDQYNNLWPRCGLGIRAPAALAAKAIAELKEGEREGVALGTNETQTGPRPGPATAGPEPSKTTLKVGHAAGAGQTKREPASDKLSN